MQLMIAAARTYGNRRLRAAGFREQHDAATDIVLWVRLPDPRDQIYSTRADGGEGVELAGGGGEVGGRGPGREAGANAASDAGNAERHKPIVFLHGLGIGLAPYADYVASLPRDRPVAGVRVGVGCRL
jgi:hypothetical protein